MSYEWDIAEPTVVTICTVKMEGSDMDASVKQEQPTPTTVTPQPLAATVPESAQVLSDIAAPTTNEGMHKPIILHHEPALQRDFVA